MKSITRLSLALIMFSLFSISYLVTSVSAQQGTNPEISPTKGGNAPTAITGAPGMDPRGNALVGIAKWRPSQNDAGTVDEVCDLVRTLTCKPDDIHGEDRSNGVDTVYAVCEGLKDACKQLRIVRGKIPR